MYLNYVTIKKPGIKLIFVSKITLLPEKQSANSSEYLPLSYTIYV